MLQSLLAITAVLFLITSSNALSIDTSHHLARHQHIARHPVVKRASGASDSARCIKRDSTSVAVPSSTSTANLASSSSQAPPSSGSGKVGIAWAFDSDGLAIKNFLTSKVSTVYTWAPAKLQDLYGLQFCPMLWGNNQVTEFQNLVKGNYANCALGFNEPDLSSQSNIAPDAAAQLWMANIQPLKDQGYTLVAPAVAFSAPWLQSFFAACTGCTFDFLAAHVYNTNSAAVINYLTGLHTTFNKNIWVTEWACQDFNGGPQCTDDQVFEFMANLTAWMDSTPWIDKYFYYGFIDSALININPANSLIDANGMPTKLGELYIGA